MIFTSESCVALQLLSDSYYSMGFSGFGVFATRHFESGDFLLDYVGEHIEPKEAYVRDDQMFIYYFNIGCNHYSLVPWLLCPRPTERRSSVISTMDAIITA